MDSGQIISNLIVMLITFILAYFFVAAEFALVQSRLSALEEAEKNATSTRRRKKFQLAIQMVQRLNEYLSTTQVGTSICGIILGWIGESTVEFFIVKGFGETHLINSASLHLVGAIVGVLLLTYLEVVITEIVPKNISIDIPIKVLMWVVTPLHYFHTIFYPFVWLLNVSANGIVRLFGMKPADENAEVFSQAEILSLSKNAVTSGELEENDLVYMQRAFDFNDKVAKDIMIDRTQLVVLDVNTTVDEAVKQYLQSRFSRFPVVANNDKDKILGYVYNYDLIRQSQVDGKISVSKLLRNSITVPESLPLQDVLQKMLSKQTPISVVVDEYGGTSGIITDKDIYEEVFGTIRDEVDDVSGDYIHKESDNLYKISGKMTVYDFERYFGIDVPDFEEEDVVTLGGYVIDNKPEIKVDEHVRIQNYDFQVLDNENAHIDWFLVHKLEPDELANVEPVVEEHGFDEED
ncbi:hemolysin family protein [Pediococcus argentinicus]|nr:hemolysin family protein [Pediococcus argentinicus]NKZ22897.1 HlyC/CorC family transporter [Pediococcus argentinicus]GEP19936.1 hemolysin [Pediococcus argentinicus]